MKAGAYAVFSFLLLAMLCWLASRHVPQPLPHRPVTPLTNWGQGSNPGAGECPEGTIAYFVEGHFLECLRGTSA